jgi:hypothetical protein
VNSLYVTNIYNHEGTYVFDDTPVGLVREPFIISMPQIIEHQMGGPIDTITAIFSAAAFPSYNTVLKRLHPEYGGTRYELDGSHLQGWGSARRCSITLTLPQRRSTCISARPLAMSDYYYHDCNERLEVLP